MSTIPFHITELVEIPPAPGGYLTLPECPVIPRKLPWTKKQAILPIVIIVLIAVMIVVMTRSGMNPMYGFFGLAMIAPMAMMWSQGRSGTTDKARSGPALSELRRSFLADLDAVRDEMHHSMGQQLDRSHHLHPDPDLLPGLIGTPRMWERSADSAEHAQHFGDIRLGTGTATSAKKIMPWDNSPAQFVVQVNSSGDPSDHEPIALAALTNFTLEQTDVSDIPISKSLQTTPMMELYGESDAVYGLARAMILQATLLHSPLDLKVMVVTEHTELWDWVKWLPHATDDTLMPADTGGPGRLVWSSPREMIDVVSDELRLTRTVYRAETTPPRPHWLVFCDTDIDNDDDDWTTMTCSGKGALGCTFVRLKTTST